MGILLESFLDTSDVDQPVPPIRLTNTIGIPAVYACVSVYVCACTMRGVLWNAATCQTADPCCPSITPRSRHTSSAFVLRCEPPRANYHSPGQVTVDWRLDLRWIRKPNCRRVPSLYATVHKHTHTHTLLHPIVEYKLAQCPSNSITAQVRSAMCVTLSKNSPCVSRVQPPGRRKYRQEITHVLAERPLLVPPSPGEQSCWGWEQKGAPHKSPEKPPW